MVCQHGQESNCVNWSQSVNTCAIAVAGFVATAASILVYVLIRRQKVAKGTTTLILQTRRMILLGSASPRVGFLYKEHSKFVTGTVAQHDHGGKHRSSARVASA
jgi:hypothetical protein